MGLLVDGKWQDKWYDTKSTGGKFKRTASQFRSWITSDGSPGPTGEGGFVAEPGRYHLYISYACPWAHRTMIFRTLKGLEEMITFSSVDWFMGDRGWTFKSDESVVKDPLFNFEYAYEIYTQADKNYTGRVTVPILWDKQNSTVVSNESSEIIRMFNSAFDGVGAKAGDYYPETLRDEIDQVNDRIYNTVNNGVYKCGFATTQAAYEEALHPSFESLDWVEKRLSTQRYLMGNKLTEADWRLFTTLVRFDPVYVSHFKCNICRIVDYPNIWEYVRELYQMPEISETVDFSHIKQHYYKSHETINPTRIVPVGPQVDFMAPHGRG